MTAVTEPSAAWRNRIVGHADVPPADLVANPRNWRTHPKDQQRALAGALGEVGWVAEVLVNRTTGHVVDGHLRIELALERAESSVPVTYIELTDEEERLVLASLDPLAAMASVEEERLAALLGGLEPADDALRALREQAARRQLTSSRGGELVVKGRDGRIRMEKKDRSTGSAALQGLTRCPTRPMRGKRGSTPNDARDRHAEDCGLAETPGGRTGPPSELFRASGGGCGRSR